MNVSSDSGLSKALISLGLQPGDALLAVLGDPLPSSLGSPDQTIEQILLVIGPNGTLVIPAFRLCSGSDDSLPPAAQALMKHSGAMLSNHPTHPVVAIGALAQVVTENHAASTAFGRKSPLFKLLQARGKVLQIGCDFAENPMVFVAEEIARPAYIDRARPIETTLPSGKSAIKWIRQPGCHRGFGVLTEALECKGAIGEGSWRATTLRLVSARSIVDEAVDALSMSDDALLCLEADCELCAESRAMLTANEAEELDKLITEQAEEDERMARSVEQSLDGGTVRFVESSEADFSDN